ncbi:MAG: DUF3667 domain-containing protein [Algoriphagus sp.]|uniref:DUF3667 domain-containing protein n=1 Tax=Algoriphagus sp. TaxID=1872435 RepID=UPI00262AFE60|nr:DUF3667 domain-containing protein [Algoriphagus sp.]MDG1279005.1 DUF3667 domain-containing protein [Algoriphagus sp.]
MSEQTGETRCKSCQSEITGDFCSACGHPKTLKRIDGNYIASEIASVVNFEKGILFTIKELLIRPGKNIETFIREDRSRLVKPLIFLIICSLAYTIAQQYLRFEDGYVAAGEMEDSAVLDLFAWVQQNYGYANILMAVFVALWIKLFFRKYQYNFFEILILLCFVMGIGMLIFTLFGVVEGLTKQSMLGLGGIFGFGYICFAIGNFFDKKRIMSYVKGLFAYLLGSITFFLLLIILGLVIDQMSKA